MHQVRKEAHNFFATREPGVVCHRGHCAQAPQCQPRGQACMDHDRASGEGVQTQARVPHHALPRLGVNS